MTDNKDIKEDNGYYLKALNELIEQNVPLRYTALCIDPIHIGDGAYRIGRIDNTIMRDKPTNEPMIPGTTIKGMMRHAALLWLAEKILKNSSSNNKSEVLKEVLKKAEDICGIIFGTAGEENSDKTESDDKAKAGLVRFYDSLPLLFPVSSDYGTVWLTTKQKLAWFSICKSEIDVADGMGFLIDIEQSENFNISNMRLGWLYLPVEKISLDLKLPCENIIKKIVIADERLFSKILNDNLDVRTSVKIDQNTGTAVGGDLFTYESIPRLTVMGFELMWPAEVIKEILKKENIEEELLINTLNRLKVLGIGGYGSKGHGRIELKPKEACPDDRNSK